jgi:hypothetical protein
MKLHVDRSRAGHGDLEIEIHHPIVMPDDPVSWMTDILGGAVVATDEMSTDLGWPFVFAHGAVASPDGAIVEHRVGGFYRFFHFVAAVIARAATADELSRQLPELIAVARSACPDFRDDKVVALAELWGESLIVFH